jgi:hypothetical protein
LVVGVREAIVQLAQKFPAKREELLGLLNVQATPDFVPHDLWPDKIWLLPLEPTKEPWYYYAPRTHPPSDLMNPGFLESVDAPIRPLVKWMHEHGIQTGPSCAGHEISPGGFQEIWQGLLEDAAKIRGPGLALKDIENGDLYVMRDPEYRLPWYDFKQFFDKADQHRLVGYLPFSTHDLRGEQLIGRWDGYEITSPEYSQYRIKTERPDPEVWKEITAQIEYWLGG